MASIAWCIVKNHKTYHKARLETKAQLSCKGHNQHVPGRDCCRDSKGQHEAHGIDCLVHCMRSRINSAARDTISTHLVETAMEIPWDSIKHIALIAWCIKVQFSCKGHNQHSPGRDCRGDPKRQHEAHGIDCLVPRMT